MAIAVSPNVLLGSVVPLVQVVEHAIVACLEQVFARVVALGEVSPARDALQVSGVPTARINAQVLSGNPASFVASVTTPSTPRGPVSVTTATEDPIVDWSVHEDPTVFATVRVHVSSVGRQWRV